LRTLHAHLPVIRNHKPVTIRITEIDPNTGWCDVFGRAEEIEEPKLSVIAGDYIHNLRSALDYVVTALAYASNAKLRESHQFPIFTSRSAYTVTVGTPAKAKRGGPLHGVIHGLDLVAEVQPYHQQPDAQLHPLALINRFSNTDKHRQTMIVMGALTDHNRLSCRSTSVRERAPRFGKPPVSIVSARRDKARSTPICRALPTRSAHEDHTDRSGSSRCAGLSSEVPRWPSRWHGGDAQPL
jgi:hypothetical protein